jgi:CDP-6-deoxy-D-xylo-4-hexulose-3-dehydrase
MLREPPAKRRVGWKQWTGPGDLIAINRIVWGPQEKEELERVFERDWFGPGQAVEEFEEALANFIGTIWTQATNSGSSALLVATRALQHMGLWKKGDYILHPATTFPTSLNPIIQAGMIPVFVDVEEGTYNLDCKQALQASELFPLKGAIVPHLLGNSPDMRALLNILGNQPLIEDCCDTLGSEWEGVKCGNLGIASAFSFYGSHHVSTAGVGGALLTSNPDLSEIAASMVAWGRGRFDHDDIYERFKDRYHYVTVGYDMQMTELQAAFGLAQMTRLAEANLGRDRQFKITLKFMRDYEEFFVLPNSYLKAKPSWFAFPLTIRDDAPFGREEIIRHLASHHIEVRPLFTGNVLKHPAYKDIHYARVGDLTQAEINHERAFFIPCWGDMTREQTEYLFGVFKVFLNKF